MNDQTLAEVRSVISDALFMDPSALPETLDQTTCARWTSLYHLTLILALEERFSTSFTTEEIVQMTSDAAIVRALERRGAPGGSGVPAL